MAGLTKNANLAQKISPPIISHKNDHQTGKEGHLYISFCFSSTDPIQMTTTTTRPVPHWGFPGSSGVSGNAWQPHSDTELVSSNATSVVVSSTNRTEAEDEAGLEDAKPKTIVVKVPKVPHNFGAIQSNKAHLPISIPPRRVKGGTAPAPAVVPSVVPVATGNGLEVVMDNFTQYCPPARARGLYWNWTLAGDTAVMQCPSGSTGFAKWSCEHGRPQAIWAQGNPSLQECVSIWLSDLDSKLR